MKRATQASLKECRISDVTTRLDLCPLRTIIQPLSSLSGTAKEISKKLDKGDEPAKSLTFIQYPFLAQSGPPISVLTLERTDIRGTMRFASAHCSVVEPLSRLLRFEEIRFWLPLSAP